MNRTYQTGNLTLRVEVDSGVMLIIEYRDPFGFEVDARIHGSTRQIADAIEGRTQFDIAHPILSARVWPDRLEVVGSPRVVQPLTPRIRKWLVPALREAQDEADAQWGARRGAERVAGIRPHLLRVARERRERGYHAIAAVLEWAATVATPPTPDGWACGRNERNVPQWSKCLKDGRYHVEFCASADYLMVVGVYQPDDNREYVEGQDYPDLSEQWYSRRVNEGNDSGLLDAIAEAFAACERGGHGEKGEG